MKKPATMNLDKFIKNLDKNNQELVYWPGYHIFWASYSRFPNFKLYFPISNAVIRTILQMCAVTIHMGDRVGWPIGGLKILLLFLFLLQDSTGLEIRVISFSM